MPTLWTFGNKKYDWVDEVADRIIYKVNDQTLNNTSLEYTYHKFNEQRHNMKFGDIVLIFLTDSNRRWFFEDPNVEQEIDKTTATAVKYYYSYLNNKTLFKSTFMMFLNDVQGWSHFRKLRIIVFPETDDLIDLIDEQRRNLFLLNIAHGDLSKPYDDIVQQIYDNIKVNKPIYLQGEYNS